jgi:hypothetical protein
MSDWLYAEHLGIIYLIATQSDGIFLYEIRPSREMGGHVAPKRRGGAATSGLYVRRYRGAVASSIG